MGLLSLVTIRTGIMLNPGSLVLTNQHVASGARARGDVRGMRCNRGNEWSAAPREPTFRPPERTVSG
jgi:hypothetical protein